MRKLLLISILVVSPLLSVKAATLDCEKLAIETVDQLVDEGLLLSAEQYQLRARIVSTSLCDAAKKSTQVSKQPKKQTTVQSSTVDESQDKPVIRGPRNR